MITIPNAEGVLVKYLRNELGVAVYQTPPRNPQGSYIRIARIGGTMRNVVTDSAAIAISVYADDSATACDLINEVRAILMNAPGEMIEGAWCRSWVEVGGPVFFPDPENVDRPSYRMNGEIRLAVR